MSDDYSDEDFEQALSDPVAWSVAENLTTAAPTSRLRERIENLGQASEKARELLAPLLVSPSSFRVAEIEHQRAYRTPEVVRLLCSAARDVRDSEPQFALLVASTATQIAAKLEPAGPQQATAEGMAWLERGIACGILGKYRDGESALARAEVAFQRYEHPTMQWELANVWLSQANIRVESERLDEALELARAAAESYFAFGDVNHGLRALLVRGGVLYLRGQYSDGVTVYEEFLECAARSGTHDAVDSLTRARATQGLGNCYAGLCAHEKAIEFLSDALALWDELAADTERIRTLWSLAGVEVGRGNLDAGIRQLEAVLRQFEALGVLNDSALTRLELAEALLAAGRANEVGPVLRDVAVNFASEGMMRNARLALAYLHEAMASGTLTTSRIRYVRAYLEHLPTRNAERFQVPS